MTDRLLTAREVADWLGLSTETVLRRWRAGELPGFRLGSNVLRFRESELEAWLEERRGLAFSHGAEPRSEGADVASLPRPAAGGRG